MLVNYKCRMKEASKTKFKKQISSLSNLVAMRRNKESDSNPKTELMINAILERVGKL